GKGAGKTTGASKKIAATTARSYRKLASGLKGKTAEDIDGWTVAPSAREVEAKTRQLTRLKAHAALSESLAEGESFGTAIVEVGRALLAESLHAEAVSIGLNLRSEPAHEEVGRVLLGMAYQRSSDPDVARAELERVYPPELIVAAADDYLPTAIVSLGHEALALLQTSREQGDTTRWSSKAGLRTAEPAFCIGSFDHVRTLVESRLEHDPESSGPAVRYELRRMLDWLPGGKHLAPLPTTAGKRNFGVLSYDQPGIRSRNIGDYIQTIASIGHLLRYEKYSISVDRGL